MLYEKIGFKANPFSRVSAEDELSYLDKIFFKPKYFTTILGDIQSNNSRYIFGERGNGKSALMFQMIAETKKNRALVALIDNYTLLFEGANNTFNKYLILMMQRLTQSLVQELLISNENINALDQTLKEKFAFFVNNFYQTTSKTEFEKYQEIHKIKEKYNQYVNPLLNQLISGTVSLTSDLIAKSFGLPVETNNKFYREYLPALQYNNQKIDLSKVQESDLNSLFDELIEVIKGFGYTNLIIFFDKVDEQPEFASNIENVAKKLSPLVVNNKILLDNRFSLVFLLWSRIKEELSKNGVRFDKLRPIDVNWNDTELESILDKRVTYFSERKVTKIRSLFQIEDNFSLVLQLSNKSPRDALNLLSCIYEIQEELGGDLSLFSPTASNKGVINFLTNYNFRSIYPPQKGTRQDIKMVISKLKKIGKSKFTINDMMRIFKKTQPSCLSDVNIMRNYGVIQEDMENVSVAKEYVIIDPKIKFIVENQMSIN